MPASGAGPGFAAAITRRRMCSLNLLVRRFQWKLVFPLITLALCYLLLFGYVISSYGELPAKVASHFDITGQPNG